MKNLPSCPQCLKDSTFIFKTRDYNRSFTNEPFSYFQCPSCHFMFLSPVPVDLLKYYRSDYYPKFDSMVQFDSIVQPEQPKLKLIQPFVKSGRLLDIGPAMGGFLYLAKKEGYETEAIEMDEKCANFLNTVLKIRAIQSSDVNKSIQKMSAFNVITLWHVIEHLKNPWEDLSSIVDKLLPGGILVIAAPNPNSLQFKIFKKRWYHLDAPRHLSLIPMSLLINNLQSLGMNLEMIAPLNMEAKMFNRSGWIESLNHFSKYPRIKIGLRFFGKITYKMMKPLEKFPRWASTYTIIFKKA